MTSLRARLRPLAHAALAIFVAVVAVPRHALVLHVHDGDDVPHVHPDGGDDDHVDDHAHPHDDGTPGFEQPEHAPHAHWQEPFQRAATPATPGIRHVVHALRLAPPPPAARRGRPRPGVRSRGPPAPDALVHG